MRCRLSALVLQLVVAGVACGDAEIEGAFASKSPTTAACAGGDCRGSGDTAAAGPSNGAKDGDESDVDCGGAVAPRCASGKSCSADSDCAESYCPEGAPRVCVTPRNDDNVKNGTETDVDCGGQSGITCAIGKACLADADCTTVCNYAKKCAEAKSCKPHFGGDTCGEGEVGAPGADHESCCRSLEVVGYSSPQQPGKKVYLDKYEITAGRVRAFMAAIAAQYGGVPNVKQWVASNTPAVWSSAWNPFLASGDEAEVITLPNASAGAPSPASVGYFYALASVLYVYSHGHNCYQGEGSYGFPTYYFPPDVMEKNGGLPRATPTDDNGQPLDANEALDQKSMNCMPNAWLQAFCTWDGGQLATDEVLNFITGSTTANEGACNGPRCPSAAQIQATNDSGSDVGLVYFYPHYADSVTHEGTSRVAAPGRVPGDVVRLQDGDEPWMDVGGNLNEAVLDMNGATFTGAFGLKFMGVGYGSARASTNPTSLTYPEHKSALVGGRCMRFR